MSERIIEVPVIKGSNVMASIKIPDGLGLLEKPTDKPAKGFGCLRVLTEKEGDKRITWDSNDFSQIQEAKELFDQCIAEGLVPYRVGPDGKVTDEPIVEFDPYFEEVVMIPLSMVAGG